MEEEIIGKLRDFLNKHTPMTEECQVVYLMVEIRKLLEIFEPINHDFLTLRLYCDWSLHTIIDRAKLSLDMRSLIERIDKSITAGATFNNRQHIPSDFGQSLYEFASLSKLKDNMISFFTNISLTDSLFVEKNWESYRNLLLKVLTDQPVIFKDPTTNIKLIRFGFAITGAANLRIEFVDDRPPFAYIGML